MNKTLVVAALAAGQAFATSKSDYPGFKPIEDQGYDWTPIKVTTDDGYNILLINVLNSDGSRNTDKAVLF